MTRRLEPPHNRLDIVVPAIKEAELVKWCPEIYPSEFRRGDTHIKGKKGYEFDLYPVTRSANVRVRSATEVIAYYFKREMGYDLPGYEAEGQQHFKDRIFLLLEGESWTGGERYGVGAIAFRWRKYGDGREQRNLSWVWIHPFLRRSGIFTTYWNLFRKIYGGFRAETPYSDAMYSFLVKMNALPPEYQGRE
jgi:hypothetical protein